MAQTQIAERMDVAETAVSRGEVVVLKPPRLPYHDAIKERFGVDKSGWKALVEAVYPNAKTPDAVVMALSYCKARNLDPFKRPVHIVPMWSSTVGAMVETVWPGISELRTTAFRTKNYAGMEEAEFGPDIEQTFKGKATKGSQRGQERTVIIKFPEWCRIAISRDLNGKERRFVGPKVYWLETYAKWADTDVPNDMWAHRPSGQLEKCAEAAALRRAFPEEIGNELTAEEMEGQRVFDPAANARDVSPRDEPPAPPPAIEEPQATTAPIAPAVPIEGEIIVPAAQSAPAKEDALDIPASLRRVAPQKTAEPAKASPAATAAEAAPHPTENPQTARDWAITKMDACIAYEQLETFWNDHIAPRENDFFPPDLEDMLGAFRRNEARFAP